MSDCHTTKLQITAIKAFDDNYIWAFQNPNSDKVTLVDPGQAEPVLAWLEDHQATIEAILVTHHHGDHTGGVTELLTLGNVPVYGSYNSRADIVSQPLKEGDTVHCAGIELRVIEVPGHTLDHIAFYSDDAAVLFSGDTLFAGGCGRVFEGTPTQMYHSLQKLAALPAQTQVYCAHEYTMGNLRFAKAVEPNNPALLERITTDSNRRNQHQPTVPSTIKIELLTNPFLRCNQTTVATAAYSHKGQQPTDDSDVFAIIRGWKDNF